MEVSISFKTKSAYNKFLRNMRNGKGSIVSNKTASLSMNGEGFGDMLKSVGKTVGKQILNEGIKAGAKAIKQQVISKTPMGLNTIGNTLVDLASDQGQKQVKGMGLPYGYVGGPSSIPRPELWASRKSGAGLFDVAKSLAKKASKSKIAGDLGNLAIKAGKQQLQQQLNNNTSGFAKQLGNVVLNEATNQASSQLQNYQGGGYSDFLGGNALLSNSINNNLSKSHKKAYGGSFRLNG